MDDAGNHKGRNELTRRGFLQLRGEFHCLRKGGDRCYAFNGENQYHCIFGGGGICYIVHPSDTAPVLIAHEAAVRVIGPKGTRSVPLEKFYVLPSQDVRKETVLRPDEILTEILRRHLRRGFAAPTGRYGHANLGILPLPGRPLRCSLKMIEWRRPAWF